MSMKLAERPGRFPMQDEHENGNNGVGMARPGASAHAECREPKPGTDSGVSQVQPAHRVCGLWAEREIRLDRARAGGAELRRAGPAGARCGASLCGKSDGDERVANDAINPGVSRPRGGEGSTLPTPPLPDAVHPRGHRAAGGSGPGARAVERAGDVPHPAARIRAVWEQYERLAKISVAHLYNLRASARYRNQAAVFEATRPTSMAIGERRRPDPHGRPGFLRVDTVHQGDWDGTKGVYHINAVDTVTQWQVVGCASKISEAYLMPVLEAVLRQFPFTVLGFHVDNGSEYINHRVANMLKKLHAEFTKSRACRSQDNALVEGKNGAVVRKLIGYGYIAGEHAESLGKFYAQNLNPYLNFHRPCGFATVSLDERGKRRRQYKTEDYRTPLEKLKSLERPEQYLKPGLSLVELDREALAMSDTECARKMNAVKSRLLRQCKVQAPLPPPFR